MPVGTELTLKETQTSRAAWQSQSKENAESPRQDVFPAEHGTFI